MTAPIVEGVFAINKPPRMTSADVLRSLSGHFQSSALFAPLLARGKTRQDAKANPSRRHRRDNPIKVKLGHGGTLDPLATGVLVVGVGDGTKSLSNFLGYSKTYYTVVLFGAATDSYDTEGKVVARAPFESVTRERVEEALGQFRGKIKQIPPLWSAIRVDGKHMYEYAREGKKPPRDLVERPMETTEVRLLDWYAGGTHSWQWPKEEAPEEEKDAAQKVFQVDAEASNSEETSLKRKISTSPAPLSDNATSYQTPKRLKTDDNPNAERARSARYIPSVPSDSQTPCPAPAALIRLTVSSGFYVRSFAHDLGKAVGSLAIMSKLVRSSQASFSLGAENKRFGLEAAKDNEAKEPSSNFRVFEYSDLEKGEEAWSSQIGSLLKEWTERQKIDEKGNNARNGEGAEVYDGRERRNTSSPEP
ncbi:MAG: hypothetical protein Q9227_008405 [Pyrenula ochraceoflavens]